MKGKYYSGYHSLIFTCIFAKLAGRVVPLRFVFGQMPTLKQNQVCEGPERIPGSFHPYFDQDDRASDALVQLLGLTAIRIQDDPILPDEDWPEARLSLQSRSLAEVTAAVQGKINPSVTWKRAAHQERWETALPLSLSIKLRKLKKLSRMSSEFRRKPSLKPVHIRVSCF